MTQFEQWNGFEGRLWKEEINVRDLHPEELQAL